MGRLSCSKLSCKRSTTMALHLKVELYHVFKILLLFFQSVLLCLLVGIYLGGPQAANAGFQDIDYSYVDDWEPQRLTPRQRPVLVNSQNGKHYKDFPKGKNQKKTVNVERQFRHEQMFAPEPESASLQRSPQNCIDSAKLLSCIASVKEDCNDMK